MKAGLRSLLPVQASAGKEPGRAEQGEGVDTLWTLLSQMLLGGCEWSWKS